MPEDSEDRNESPAPDANKQMWKRGGELPELALAQIRDRGVQIDDNSATVLNALDELPETFSSVDEEGGQDIESDNSNADEDGYSSDEAEGDEESPRSDEVDQSHDNGLQRVDSVLHANGNELSEEFQQLHLASRNRELNRHRSLLAHLQDEEDAAADDTRRHSKDVGPQHQQKRGWAQQRIERRSVKLVGEESDVATSADVEVSVWHYESSDSDAYIRTRHRLRVKTRDAKADPCEELSEDDEDEDGDEQDHDVRIRLGMTQQERDAAFQKLLMQYLGLLQCAPAEVARRLQSHGIDVAMDASAATAHDDEMLALTLQDVEDSERHAINLNVPNVTGSVTGTSGRLIASTSHGADITSTSTPPRKGKKRKQGTNVSIDLQTKIRIIEVAEQYQYDPKSSSRSKQDGGLPSHHGKEIVNGIRLAEQFGLNKSTVSRILKRKEEFKKAYYKDNISGCSKHINKKSKFDKLNRLVENWFDMNREKNGTITDTLIRDVGKRYAEELGIEDFRGSNGWVRSLRNRKENTARNTVSIEEQAAEKRKKDNEAIERMRSIFPNGVKDMAGFFKDLSTYLEKDGAGMGGFGDISGSNSSSTNGSARDAAVVLAGASYTDMDECIPREDDGAMAEEFLKKKMIDSLRIWSQELMASELAKLKKRMKPRQAAILRAEQFEDPSMTLETKMARIWQALLRHSEKQILAACGASALLRNVLVGGLANSIYAEYDPDQGFEKQQQYADVVGRQSKHVVAQEEEIVKLVKLRELAEQHVFDQLSAAGVGQLLQQMDLSRRVNAVTEMLAPVLDDELLLVLWNATATTQASANQLVRSQASDNDEADPAQEKMSWKETRKRGAALASLVLQERVRLVILVWQRLSPEEKNLAYKALDPSISATQAAATLKSVLHALEETYVSELIHHQRQLSRRNLNLASQLGIINESKATTTGRQLALAPTTPRALGKLRISRGRSRTMLLTGNTVDSGSRTPQSSSIVFKPRTFQTNVFDLLCEVEQQQVAALERHNGEHGVHLEDIEEGILMQARVKLRDLLCTYIEPSEPIQERFHRCEEAREKRLELDRSRSDDERKLTELVRAIISGQRRNPELLVNVVNRSPETLLSAMSLNPGMLLFSIVKFPEQVKRFLSLDSKACDYLDALVQKHKGVQLLWRPPGGNYSHDTFLPTNKMRKLSVAAEEYALALPVGDSLEQGAMLLLEWFTSHLNDLTELLLEHPKPLQLLFSKMHQRGDVSAFYQMMLLLQQTPGVQNFISRASVGTLERLALEDQTAVLAVLREIFQCRENCTESGESPQPRANRDLLHELQASPHLLTCLSSMDPNVLQEVFLGNVDVWGPFFVDMVASNDALLRQSLVQRTNYAEGGDTLLRLLTAVIDGTTAVLDLEALDRALSAPDVEQEKQRQATPFVCDYLAARYNAPAAVGARLENLLNGLLAFQDDYRVAFFASVCGLGEVKTSDAFESGPPSYDVFLYYMHALAHLFYGQMKIFQSGKRLDETAKTALRALRAEIEGLPRIRAAAIAGMTDIPVPESTSEASGENSVDFIHDTDDRTRFVELDDLMSIFLQQWTAKTRQTEEAFVANDLGGDRIGMDEFIKIVIGVTAGRISARECRLVFSDAGQEFMTLDVFMRVTRAYQLRVFDTHLPEVNLDERDLQDLRLSVGRANIASTQREVEDLARYWRSVRSDVVHQLEAAHQKKTTKSLLKNQSALIEKLVANTPPLQQQLQIQQPYAKRQATSSAHTAALQEKLDRVWHEVRTCVAMLHRAKLTQHYLSGLFIRSNMLRWIRQARKRAHEEEKRLQSLKMRGEDIDAVPRTQHLKPTEQVRGIHSGELFVRLNGSKLCEPQGTLHGAHPFLLKLLHLQDNDKSNVQRLVQPSEAKLAFTRNLRRQIRQRRRKTKERWDAVRDVIKVYNNGNVRAIANHLTPAVNPASSALDRYLQQFQRLEQAYKQQVTSDILHVYALLEAESKYITAWNKREEAKYRDQHALTNMLFQFNSFSFQLESETSGQVRMWRLPVSDPQRKRCVKAATENIKKRFFSSPGQSLEVLEVYKIDNRVLLNSFQNFTNSLSNSLSNSPSKTRSEIKIKGLFCSVPADSVERCVAYGMHAVNEETGEPRFLDAQEAEIKVFNRSTTVKTHQERLLHFVRARK
ncbi:hypothetical protein JG687_00009248 [Phytophthora cactorum]|uniref:HTH CENPB-type domain-containing protein n=1 Tax=Phytophthora cactorum TaxID=29920 RepID=A0A8T1UCN4_9STRA|nr:hypothetical protein JG687_00009248 [Phytophthora cactorum]